MKKIFSLLMAALLLIVVSCSKKGGVDPPTPQPPTGPAAPLVLDLATDTALYNGVATVRVLRTDGQVVKTGSQIVNGTITFSGLTRDTTIVFTAINSNEHGSSASKSTAITVPVYSAKTTQFHNTPPVIMVFSKSCLAGTENSSSAVWHDGPIDCNRYKFYANGDAEIIQGTCSANPGSVIYGPKSWKWKDNEEAIDFGAAAVSGPGEVWKVTVYPNGFDRSQFKNGYYTLQKYRVN